MNNINSPIQFISILRQGVGYWNQWRDDNPEIRPRLADIDLSAMDLSGVDFVNADLRRSNLNHTILREADLRGANLISADLRHADLSKANLKKARLQKAQLSGAKLESVYARSADMTKVVACDTNFYKAYLRGVEFIEADLRRAILRRSVLRGATLTSANMQQTDLREVNLVGANLHGADISEAWAYGISTWDTALDGIKQEDILISRQEQPTITVDNLEVAQFIHLLINGRKLRDALDTINSKVVLILGRFTTERKAVLDAIRKEMRQRDFVPLIFDFDKPSTRDTLETISTLAHIARFVIADLTEAKSVLQELQAIVPNLPSVPVQPILAEYDALPGMIDHFQNRRNVNFLPVYRYQDTASLLANIEDAVMRPAEQYLAGG
ncbi:MAG: pentapeptide repeat-containing protein [Thiolinea sp.]